MNKLTSSRPRVEGAREDEILDATLELLLEVGVQWHDLRTSAHQGAQGRRDS